MSLGDKLRQTMGAQPMTLEEVAFLGFIFYGVAVMGLIGTVVAFSLRELWFAIREIWHEHDPNNDTITKG
jgi:hypothetical protein